MLDLYEALSPDMASEGTFALARSRSAPALAFAMLRSPLGPEVDRGPVGGILLTVTFEPGGGSLWAVTFVQFVARAVAVWSPLNRAVAVCGRPHSRRAVAVC